MTFWNALIILTVAVLIASAIIGQVLAFAVMQVHPDIDPGELNWRIKLVLTCMAVLGMVWWYPRQK
jgi:type III secretory pathway component EscS